MRGDALVVARKRRHMHGLAGAIDAALGIDEGVEPGRGLAAGDAAIRQIERRAFQIEERVIAAAYSLTTSSAGDDPPSPRARPARTAA